MTNNNDKNSKRKQIPSLVGRDLDNLVPHSKNDLSSITQHVNEKFTVNRTELDQIGFQCNTCNQFFRNSLAYLNHMNSKSHQLKLGRSMKIKTADLKAIQKEFAKTIEDDLKEIESQHINPILRFEETIQCEDDDLDEMNKSMDKIDKDLVDLGINQNNTTIKSISTYEDKFDDDEFSTDESDDDDNLALLDY
eukprot:TRINITY_DN1756_c0_g1_i1.p1 TRINITY_DN1756_c0_g1~~TRINITY_DN1756_c0_g1_i1.p1  ORF type:complete len:193 (+),score=57.44 TRINITY_DN1756_c0_g1_i1:68-646(+)